MHQSLLHAFGTSPHDRVNNALDALRKGRGILVVDNEARENEGDLIFSAQHLTVDQMAMLIRECSGIVCLCLPEDKVRALGLPMMVEENTSRYGTGFTVSIEAAEGVTTGVSAADRVTTVRAAIAAGMPGPTTCAARAMSFPFASGPAGCWSARATPRPWWTSCAWPGWSPAGCSAS